MERDHRARPRLGLLVTGMTYRHPSVFAAEAITIDHASNGRLELSYGAAWFDPEHQALGIPFPPLKERIDAFEEAVQIVRGLLTTDSYTFEGEHFQVRGATLLPRPLQQPHPPIWIGASGEQRMMPIAARHADVWHCFGPVDVLGAKSQRLSDMAVAADRDPGEIRRAVVALARRGSRRRCPHDRRLGSRGLRVPRLWLARPGAQPGRGVRAPLPRALTGTGSDQGEAAVHGQHLPGDVARVTREQEHGHVRHLPRGSLAPQRHGGLLT